MTPEGIKFIKEEWIPALRSGKYAQGTGKLRDTENLYCCLGVACDLLTKPLNIEVGKTTYSYHYNEMYEYLPTCIKDYLGLDSAVEEKLVILNDEENKSFSEIADYLEGIVAKHEGQNVTVLD